MTGLDIIVGAALFGGCAKATEVGVKGLTQIGQKVKNVKVPKLSKPNLREKVAEFKQNRAQRAVDKAEKALKKSQRDLNRVNKQQPTSREQEFEQAEKAYNAYEPTV